ncbi:MAG: hypothetical protein GX801_12175 [Fibrobacter sp.]|nr:hypothetical protein [Fibrobacter sp.]
MTLTVLEVLAKEEEKISIDGDLFTMFFNEDIITVEKSVKILYMDMIITAEKAQYKRNIEEVIIEDNVLVRQEDNIIKSPYLWVDVEEEYIIFSGGVEATYFYAQKEGEEKEAIYIWSDTLDVWDGAASAWAQGNVRAIYQDFTLTAEEAHLDQKEETLTMLGNVYVEREDGSWFSCQKGVYDFVKETITAYGSAEDKVKSEFIRPKDGEN